MLTAAPAHLGRRADTGGISPSAWVTSTGRHKGFMSRTTPTGPKGLPINGDRCSLSGCTGGSSGQEEEQHSRVYCICRKAPANPGIQLTLPRFIVAILGLSRSTAWMQILYPCKDSPEREHRRGLLSHGPLHMPPSPCNTPRRQGGLTTPSAQTCPVHWLISSGHELHHSSMGLALSSAAPDPSSA